MEESEKNRHQSNPQGSEENKKSISTWYTLGFKGERDTDFTSLLPDLGRTGPQEYIQGDL